MSEGKHTTVNRRILVIFTVLALSITVLMSLPVISADDMVSPSGPNAPGGYLDIEFIIDQDVVNSGDSLYVTVKVMENNWPVAGAMVTLTSTHPDNVTITIIDDVTDLDGLARFVMLGEVDTETTIDRKSTRLNSSHIPLSRMPSSA